MLRRYDSSPSQETVVVVLGKRGDWDGFLTLTTDNLAQIVILPAILLGTFRLAPEVVYGGVPAELVLTLFIGQLAFALIAWRLAACEVTLAAPQSSPG